MNEAEVKKIVDDEIARIITEPSKIKYRSSSIFSTIKNYGKRMKKLEKSLEDAKKDIRDFKYGPGEVNRDGSFLGGYADVRLNRAVNRVARLEAEIIQLTGNEIKPENYINNRAIKLKNTMMKNFVKNSYNGYAQLSAEGYDKLFNEKEAEDNEDVSYEEEKAKFENKVSEFENDVQDEIEEKIAAANAEVEDEVDVNEVDTEETQETVDETFDEEARSQAISEAFDEEEVEEETPITPIINIQPREMSKVTPATVATGINDDVFGTEEREVPVVVEEREEINYKNIALKDFIVLAELDAHIKAERDPAIIENLKARFEKYSMELSDVQTKLSPEELSEVLQALPEEVQNEIVVISTDENEKEEVAEETAEEVVEETPVEKEEIEVVKEPTVVTKENNVQSTTAESINVIKILKKQNDLLEEKEARVLEEQEELTARYEEAKKKLIEKKRYLEETATERNEAIKKIEQQNAQTKAELDAIFDAVEGSFDTNEKKK